MKICNDCGWACEVVHKDYGDDLLVQTHYRGHVDHSKIWIQVKGTTSISRFQSKRYGYSIRVSLDHALKWARSADLVVVVLWEVGRDYGLWVLPKDCIDEWTWRFLDTGCGRLIFDDKSAFNKAQLNKIAWMARIFHYERLFYDATAGDVHHFRFETDEVLGKREHKSKTPLIAFDFLRLISVLNDSGLSLDFHADFKKAKAKIKKKMPDASVQQVAGMGVIAAILMRLYIVSGGCGMPTLLLDACSDLTERFLRIRQKAD